MRRLLAVLALALAIAAWLALPAFACSYESPVVCAPAASNTGTPGSYNNRAPGPSQKAQLPNNQGTQTGANQSPAVQNGNCGYTG
jgi:hypothetical protein